MIAMLMAKNAGSALKIDLLDSNLMKRRIFQYCTMITGSNCIWVILSIYHRLTHSRVTYYFNNKHFKLMMQTLLINFDVDFTSENVWDSGLGLGNNYAP